MATVSPTLHPAPVMKRPVLGWLVHDGLVVTRRNVIQTLRVPEAVFYSLVQPVIFVVMFAYVFGGAIPIGPGAGADAYREYLVPGIFAQTVAFAAASSTIGLAEDMHKGIVDRFRSLPMAASAVLFGRTAADAVRQVLVLFVLSITGLVVGWRVHNGLVSAVEAYLLLLLFAYTVSWVGSWIGLHMPNPETANTAGLIWLFPLTFLSNLFVPINSMPDGIRLIAEWNPISALALACRQLFGNPTGIPPDVWSLQNPALYTVLSCVVIVAVFAPLAVRHYRRSSG